MWASDTADIGICTQNNADTHDDST